jgi:hypothetical protein
VTGDRPDAQCAPQVVVRDLLLGYVLLHHGVVVVRRQVDEVVAGRLGRLAQAGRDLLFRPFLAGAAFFP